MTFLTITFLIAKVTTIEVVSGVYENCYLHIVLTNLVKLVSQMCGVTQWLQVCYSILLLCIVILYFLMHCALPTQKWLNSLHNKARSGDSQNLLHNFYNVITVLYVFRLILYNRLITPIFCFCFYTLVWYTLFVLYMHVYEIEK